MSQSLTDLEAKRSTVLQQFVNLGDLRPGSIRCYAHKCTPGRVFQKLDMAGGAGTKTREVPC
jgi:hypothetical protein